MYTGVFLPRNELGASDREEAEKLTDSSSKIFPRRTILLRISTATIRFDLPEALGPKITEEHNAFWGSRVPEIFLFKTLYFRFRISGCETIEKTVNSLKFLKFSSRSSKSILTP